jgi:hypothetical protein
MFTSASRALAAILLFPLGALALAGCGEDCAIGATEPCACPDGSTGVRVCEMNAEFGACQCDDPALDGGSMGTDAGPLPGDAGPDFCADMPCLNGGTCESGAEGFTCTCTDEFTGDTCETRRLDVASLFEIVSSPGTWTESRAAADARGTPLAILDTEDKAGAVVRLARTFVDSHWIGGFQNPGAADYAEPDGGWRWVDGTPLVFTAWNPGEPSGGAENWLNVWGTFGASSIGLWNDELDVSQAGYIAEHEGIARFRNPDNGHYYVVIRDRTFTWAEAAARASFMWLGDRQGQLVSIETAAEQTWIGETLGWDYYWVGARQDRGDPAYGEPADGWRWVSGEPVAYSNWSVNEPNEFTEGENWMSVFPDGVWNDNQRVWDYDPSNAGFIVEFANTTRVAYIGQQDGAAGFRTPGQLFDPGADLIYGTAGYVLYCVGSGPVGGPLVFESADPLTYDRDGYQTLVEEPSYLTLANAGQDTVVGGAAGPLIDDPRGGGQVQSGLAINNNVGRGGYASLVTLTITAPPPDVFRVGVILRGAGEDRMARVLLEQTTGGTSFAIGETAGTPETMLQFFDIAGAEIGDVFTLSALKNPEDGFNPNVAYMGLVFD